VGNEHCQPEAQRARSPCSRPTFAGASVLAVSGVTRGAAAQTRDDDLCWLPAAALLALYQERKVSPVEVLKAQIARAERVNPSVYCFTHTYFDSALVGVRSMRGDARALEGIPTSVKNDDAIAERPVTAGSVLIKDNRATESTPVVDKLLAAGGCREIMLQGTSALGLLCRRTCSAM
jgi:amidase